MRIHWRDIPIRGCCMMPRDEIDCVVKVMVGLLPRMHTHNDSYISDTEVKDGERLPVVVKDMGSCEIFPQTIAHNPNGRFVVVSGDGEYIIYTAMALRNKAFGTAQEFVWASDSSEYATLESSSTIKVFKNFKERKSFKPDYGAEGMAGNDSMTKMTLN